MAISGPRGEQEKEPRVGPGDHGMALTRIELEHVAGSRGDPLAGWCRQLDLPLDDHDPGVLVNLVLLKLLANRQLQQDRPRVVRRREDPRLMGFRGECPQVPAPHPMLLWRAYA